jgi:hypothetical protein
MEIETQVIPTKPRREPWNKGRLIAQKPPLRPEHVWSIPTRLQMEGRTRDCKRRSKNPSLKRPVGPVAPE